MTGQLKPVAIVGFGGHGKVVAAALISQGRSVVAATDLQHQASDGHVWPFELLTDDELLRKFSPEQIDLVLGLGSIWPCTEDALRRRVVAYFESKGFRFSGLCHPSAVIAHNVHLATTAQVHAGVVVQPGTVVGEHAILNTRAAIDHDSYIGNYCHIGPGVTLSGNVSVGDGTHLGTASCVIQGVSIGKNSFVAASAAVVQDLTESQYVRGIPAKPFEPSGKH